MTVISRGLEGIVAASTKLSDVRGEEGILLYCGYDINELAQKVGYEEVVYLLWNGRLPNRKELEGLKGDFRRERTLPEPLVEYLKNIPKDACPMDTLRTGISMLGLYDKRDLGENAPIAEVEKVNRARALSITAKVGIIAAYFHRARQGKPLPPVRKDLDEAAHFLYLMTGEEPNPKAVQTLDLCYVLHADHGLNASTFSARVCASTLTDMYSSVVAAIGALKGPLHGGANEGVIHMLEEIGSVDRVDAWVHKRLENKQKIMGIGHRIYKVLDPRAPILKKMAIELSKELNEPQWMDIAENIASIMLKEKNLYANVDFYSAIVYHCLGIPTDLFTPIFTIARTSGWTAHILEQCADNRLFRPLSEYVGEELGKKVVPIDKR